MLNSDIASRFMCEKKQVKFVLCRLSYRMLICSGKVGRAERELLSSPVKAGKSSSHYLPQSARGRIWFSTLALLL